MFARRAMPAAEVRRLPSPRQLLEMLGLGELTDTPVNAMSGGEQQRVALAVTVSSGAGLLLADEPTSQLGHADRDTMVDLIQRVNAELGTTVVIVTHDPDIAARIPRRITIRNGRIGSEGVHGRDYAVIDQDGAVHLPEEWIRGLPAGLAGGVRGDRGRVLRPPRRLRAGRREVSTFLAGLRSRRWLNVGVFLLGVLAMVVAVATPLYARSSAEHLLDQRTEQRARQRDGPERRDRAAVAAAAGGRSPHRAARGRRSGRRCPSPRRSGTRCSARSPTWSRRTPRTPTGCPRRRTCSPPGSTCTGANSYQINTYWRDGMCENADVEGSCPSAPGEALMDPTMLQTIDAEIGDKVTVVYTGFGGDDSPSSTIRRPPRSSAPTRSTTTPSPYWFNPGHTGGDGSLRPPSLGSTTPPQAPALLVDQSSVTFNAAAVAGADRARRPRRARHRDHGRRGDPARDLADRDRRPGRRSSSRTT